MKFFLKIDYASHRDRGKIRREKYTRTAVRRKKKGWKKEKQGKRETEGAEGIGVRSNTHRRNEICAQTSSRRNVNPIFPGITSGLGGKGRGWLHGGGAHFSTKDLFSIPRGVARYELLSQTATLCLATLFPPTELFLSFLFVPVSLQRALFMRSSGSCIFAKIGRVERNGGWRASEKKRKRVAAGCGDLFLATYPLRSLAGRPIEPRRTPRRCYKGLLFYTTLLPFGYLWFHQPAKIIHRSRNSYRFDTLNADIFTWDLLPTMFI